MGEEGLGLFGNLVQGRCMERMIDDKVDSAGMCDYRWSLSNIGGTKVLCIKVHDS